MTEWNLKGEIQGEREEESFGGISADAFTFAAGAPDTIVGGRAAGVARFTNGTNYTVPLHLVLKSL